MIYLDNAATTMTNPEALEAMLPYFCESFGNPSSIYEFAGISKEAIEDVRKVLADMLGAKPDEIYFTSGGTESDNWALKSIARKNQKKGKHIITSAIEHHAILNTCHYLEEAGYEVSYIDVDEMGKIKLEELKKAIRDDTILISVMTANNEIGTLQPIKEIGEIANKNNIIFHTDAVQAFGHLPIDVEDCHIDLLSASSHKFNGPKGVGFLYVREGIETLPFMHGGAQENKMRAGTYNVPGIVGMGRAAMICRENMEERIIYETELRNHLIERMLKEIPYIRLNGHSKSRLPNNANFCIQFVEGEALLIMLGDSGICASTASACSTKSSEPSHVLLAIGLPQELSYSSLRLTLSHETTKEQIDFTVEEVKKYVQKLRSMSPVYEDFMNGKPLDI